jgi:membrane protein insertase Oxa1/YidC/SpoIIIJ
MAEPAKIVKGGFRATLALIISVIALLVSILGYTSSQSEKDLTARIQDFQAKMEKMKADSAEQIDKIRNETAKALEKMSSAIKNEGQKSAAAPAKPTDQTNNQ